MTKTIPSPAAVKAFSVKPDPFAVLTQAAFVLALALVAARAIMLETLRDSWQVTPGETAVAGGPGAATSLILDLACALPAFLVLLRRLVDKTYVLRWSSAAGLFFVVAAFAGLSTLWATDKFAAIVSAFHLLAAACLCWAAVQLVRSWLRLRVVAGVAFGLLLINLAAGYYYRFVDLPDMQKDWEANKATILRQRGWEPDSFSAKQFEQKVMSGELFGFSSSANSYAAVLVLLGTVAVGSAVQRVSDKDPRGWAIAVAAAVLLTFPLLAMTKSKGALVSPILVAGFFVLIRSARGRLGRASRALFWAGVGAAVLLILAVVGHGLYHHGLPTASLNFRWRYWVAAARMFRDHPIVGVGFANFGEHYLRYRLPVASEEVKDPHNFLVRAFTELGAIGGALVVAWVGRLWWELTRPNAPASGGIAPAGAREGTGAKPQAASKRGYPALSSLAWIVVAAILVNAACAIDWTQNGSYVAIELLKRLLWGCALLLGASVVGLRSGESPDLDDRPAPWLLYGVLVALAVFLLHNLIEFSLFETGNLLTFALLAGTALGLRAGAVAGKKRQTVAAATAMGAGTLAWLAAAIALVVPTALAEGTRHEADDDLRQAVDPTTGALRPDRFDAAVDRYAQAFAQEPLNGEYMELAGQARIAQVQAMSEAGARHRPVPPLPERWDDAAKAAFEQAAAADPTSIKSILGRARLALLTRDRLPPAAAQKEVMDGFTRALDLNPNDVQIRIEYANALATLGVPAEAKRQFQKVLWYNDQLDAAEPKRLSPAELNHIEEQIAKLP